MQGLILVVTLLAPPLFAAGESTAETEVRHVVARVAEAAGKLDVEAMAALRAPELVSVAGGHDPVGYTVWLEQLRGFYATLRSCDFRWGSVEVSFIDPRTAVVAGTWSFSAVQKDGEKLEVQGAETYVLVLREGRWLILHQHESYRG